jgi:hypothetical protein
MTSDGRSRYRVRSTRSCCSLYCCLNKRNHEASGPSSALKMCFATVCSLTERTSILQTNTRLILCQWDSGAMINCELGALFVNGNVNLSRALCLALSALPYPLMDTTKTLKDSRTTSLKPGIFAWSHAVRISPSVSADGVLLSGVFTTNTHVLTFCFRASCKCYSWEILERFCFIRKRRDHK